MQYGFSFRATRWKFYFLLCISLLPFISTDCVNNGQKTWCGCGIGKMALGPCIGGQCPDGYMCICDYCCEGCQDDCYDCALFAQFCENMSYCELRQKCQRTCAVCTPATIT